MKSNSSRTIPYLHWVNYKNCKILSNRSINGTCHVSYYLIIDYTLFLFYDFFSTSFQPIEVPIYQILATLFSTSVVTTMHKIATR